MKRENCWKPSDEDFIALATGELLFWKAPPLRRHIADCPDCAAAFAEMTAVMGQARAERNTPTGDALRERLWATFPPASEPPRRAVPTLTRRVALGGVGVAVAAAALTLAFLPGTPGRPIIAFAQVEKAMGDIRTVTWRSRVLQAVALKPGGKYDVEKIIGGDGGVHWVRLDPPTWASGGGKRRTVTTATGSWAIDEEPSGIVYYGHTRFDIPATLASGPETEGTPRERLLSAILFPRPDEGEKEWTQWGRDVRRTPWRVHQETLDGKNVLRFEAEVTYKGKIRRGGQFGWDDTGENWTVWVDPENYRIVKRRTQYNYSNGKQTVANIGESYDFRYNATPPAGIFDYTPAVGTRYSYRAFNQHRATDAEETAIRHLVRRAAAAWNRRDAAAYAAQWDFDYLDLREDQRARERRIQLQKMMTAKPVRPLRITEILNSATRPTGIFTQETPETPFPPTQSNEYRTFLTLTDAQGKKWAWLLNLRKEGGDFRIVRAEFWPFPKSASNFR